MTSFWQHAANPKNIVIVYDSKFIFSIKINDYEFKG